MLKTEDELRDFAERVIKNARRSLKRNKKNASGDLYNSLDYELNVHKNSFSLQFFMMPYGTYIDEGVSGKSKKYNTPYRFGSGNFKGQGNKWDSNIKQWIKQKGIRGRDAKGRFIKADSLSFLIRRSIYDKGIKPTHFFSTPFQNAYKRLSSDLLNSFGLDIDDFLEQTLNS